MLRQSRFFLGRQSRFHAVLVISSVISYPHKQFAGRKAESIKKNITSTVPTGANIAFRPCLVYSSHQMFGHMHRALNAVENNN